MFSYKTLENTSIDVLYDAFLNAFFDYEVKMDVPILKFQKMLERSGYVPNISMGAFKNDTLVGFVFNGFRDWNGKPTIYDTGTGVLKEYREQGITSNMFINMRELLKEKGVEQYLLEVIQSNVSAVKLYQKQGFEITRDLICFQLDKNKYNPMTSFKVEHVHRIDSTDWKNLKEFWDFEPSWQNSIDSINATADTFLYSIVRFEENIIGYGIIDKKSGGIAQIAVNKNYRRKGIARSIITDLLRNTESCKITALNVDNQSKTTKDFLLKLGFKHSVSQYEMVLKY